MKKFNHHLSEAGTETPTSSSNDVDNGSFSETVVTTGRALPDGAIVEQIAGGKLLMCVSHQQKMGATAIHKGIRYQPWPLDRAYERALHLPDGTLEFGSVGSLLEDLAGFVERSSNMGEQLSFLLACFSLATWVEEFLRCPLVLNLVGATSPETELLELLRHICRRSLPICDCSLRQLSQLPDGLSPTLFLRQPPESSARRLFAVASDRDVLYGEQIVHFTGSIVMLTRPPVPVPALRVTVPTAGPALENLLQPPEILSLQRKLLAFRLSSWQRVSASSFDAPMFGAEVRNVARALGACLDGEAALQERLLSLLAERNEIAQARSSESLATIVSEGMLALVHEGCGKAYVGEVASMVNAILLARQETTQLRDQAVGGVIRDELGLVTPRDRHGFYTLLNAPVAAAIHQEAFARRALSLIEPRPGCSYCDELFRERGSSDTANPSASSAFNASCIE